MEKSTINKPKIEAIYPLNTMQQGLLFHHIISESDQGFLQLQTRLEGELNQNLLKQAWEAAVKRHEILRTTVHWDKLEKPVQVVRPDLKLNWNYYEWKTVEESDHKEAIENFKSKKEERTINFEKGPLAKVNIISFSETVHYLIWNCHHLLLDGWSSSILLNDIFEYYNSYINNSEPDLNAIPATKSYFKWLNKQNPHEAIDFWKETLMNFNKAVIFNAKESPLKGSNRNTVFILSKEQTATFSAFSKKHKITLNTFFQGVWGLLVAKFFGEEKVLFGTTVSGRNNSFPNMDMLAGMFANVLPVAVDTTQNPTLVNFFKDLQVQQQKARKFEHITVNEISSFIVWSSSSQMFDSLFIFENFPWNVLDKGGIKVHAFESGITTTYPFTFTIQLDDDRLKINLISDKGIINDDIGNWFFENLKTVLFKVTEEPLMNISGLYENLDSSMHLIETLQPSQKEEKKKREGYFAAKNKLQLQLTEIWETIFGRKNINIHDNFFQIGGKSLMAVKMLTLLEKKLGIKLPPQAILKHPTIASLSKFIEGGDASDPWKFIVPLRAKGTKTPLFCIHGGGGHVFFYNPLVDNLDPERPVYALQPSGLDEKEDVHKSIEQMAKSYAEEISQILPNGPYNLMVYCFSTAVGIEIAKIFAQKKEITNLIVADSVLGQEDILSPDRLKIRIVGFAKRFGQNPLKAIKLMLHTKLMRFVHPPMIKFFGTKGEKNIEKIRKNLRTIYNQYDWKTKNEGSVTLILTEKSDVAINNEYIEGWNNITMTPVKVLYNSGNHLTLFEGENVDNLASNIEKSILESR
ncbi:condensation domain-containing protein [Maribacter sp. 2210JD10-5]|uniref:condensation domain-containing protein n=1 Tax=Maribacter sp. 2210JD10-5 TaxID=3386272 RepID=UPI0039BD45C0